jgi:hypothetical protein
VIAKLSETGRPRHALSRSGPRPPLVFRRDYRRRAFAVTCSSSCVTGTRRLALPLSLRFTVPLALDSSNRRRPIAPG